MKIVKLCLVVLLTLTLFACSTEENISSPSGDTGFYEMSRHQVLSDISMPGRLSAFEGFTLDIPEVGLEKVIVKTKVKANDFDSHETSRYVYLLGDYRYDKKDNIYDSYLAVEKDDKTLFYDFGHFSLKDYLYLCDVDGDGLDEILVQQITGMSEETGPFSSYVFKVVDEKIQEVFSSSTAHSFNTGFYSEYSDSNELKILNTFTGYSALVDISYIDASVKSADIWCGSLRVVAPKDIDEDGVIELFCLQHVFLEGRTECLGNAQSILKYNPISQKFEVIQTEFFPTLILRER